MAHGDHLTQRFHFRSRSLKTCFYTHVRNNIIHKNYNVKAALVPTYKRAATGNVVHPRNGVLLSFKEVGDPGMLQDGPGGHSRSEKAAGHRGTWMVPLIGGP